jgi:hypothetical protein
MSKQELYALFDCKDSTEVLSKGYEHALVLVTQTIDKIMTGGAAKISRLRALEEAIISWLKAKKWSE